jgi:hypothetical protein
MKGVCATVEITVPASKGCTTKLRDASIDARTG